MASFLGKKISLISKAGIRYEGILYTIDQVAFTVALSKVKSFGTEDRTTDRFIAARDEVYEYIIFRGSDISDLHVCENSLYTDDSAIVKMMAPNNTNPSSPPAASAQINGPTTNVSVPEPKPHHQEPESPVFQQPMNINKGFLNFSKVNNNRAEEHGSRHNHQEQPNHWQSKRDQSYNDKYEDPDDLEERAAQDYRQFQNREHVPKSDFYDHFPEESHRYSSNRRPSRQRQSYRVGPTYTRGYSSGGGTGGNQAYRYNKEVSVDLIKDDFDFESSNALMAEELAHMQVGGHDGASKGDHNDGQECEYGGDEGSGGDDVSGGHETQDKAAFYDKTKSFFDNISSEVSDRSGAQSDRRHKNNCETFGATEYGGRGGRGYRGNGGGGGGVRWARGPFRGNYGRGSSAGFLRRGGSSQRGDGRGGRGGQGNPRRPMPVGGGSMSGFGHDN